MDERHRSSRVIPWKNEMIPKNRPPHLAGCVGLQGPEQPPQHCSPEIGATRLTVCRLARIALDGPAPSLMHKTGHGCLAGPPALRPYMRLEVSIGSWWWSLFTTLPCPGTCRDPGWSATATIDGGELTAGRKVTVPCRARQTLHAVILDGFSRPIGHTHARAVPKKLICRAYRSGP
jgi:hypothetical protein